METLGLTVAHFGLRRILTLVKPSTRAFAMLVVVRLLGGSRQFKKILANITANKGGPSAY